MPRTTPTTAERAKQITYEEFMAKHESELLAADDSSAGEPISPTQLMKGGVVQTRQPMNELRRFWLFRLLRAAARENCPEAFSSLLRFWLYKMDLEPPAGVFIPPRGKPGRPRLEKTEKIYLTWIDLGRPSLFGRKLASVIYKGAFTKADSKGRKRMIDRCRRAVERQVSRLNPQPK